MVREHLSSFLDQASVGCGEGYPRFIEHEFRRYLECDVHAHGFAGLRCPHRGEERLVAFSCKGRLCPSRTGRRMADIAAHLVDELLPEAVYRQWVLTFPWLLRFRLAVDRPLSTALVREYLHTLFAWQRRRGRALGTAPGTTGAVIFVQRFVAHSIATRTSTASCLLDSGLPAADPWSACASCLCPRLPRPTSKN